MEVDITMQRHIKKSLVRVGGRLGQINHILGIIRKIISFSAYFYIYIEYHSCSLPNFHV